MIGSISNSAAQAGGTVLIKVASEAAQVFNTSKDQGAPSSQGGESLNPFWLNNFLQALSAPKSETRPFVESLKSLSNSEATKVATLVENTSKNIR